MGEVVVEDQRPSLAWSDGLPAGFRWPHFLPWSKRWSGRRTSPASSVESRSAWVWTKRSWRALLRRERPVAAVFRLWVRWWRAAHEMARSSSAQRPMASVMIDLPGVVGVLVEKGEGQGDRTLLLPRGGPGS